MTLPATQPQDGNGRTLEAAGYDTVNGKFVLAQMARSAPASGQLFSTAPALTQPASQNTAVAAGTTTAAAVVKAAPGFLSGVVVTTAPSAATSIYDNASAASGTVIGYIPADATAGQYYPFNMPAANGITVGKVNGSAGITVAYS